MKNKIKYIAVLLAIASMGYFSSTSYAYEPEDVYGPPNTHQGPHHPGPKGPWMEKMHQFKERVIENLIEELEITPQQQEEIKASREKFKEKAKTVHESLRDAMKELHEELGKTDVDTRKVRRTAATINKLQGQILDLRIDGILAVREILTDEQYEQLQEKKKKAKEFFKKRIEERKKFREEFGF